jgi:hypothetical protein
MSFLMLLLMGVATALMPYGCIVLGDLFSRRWPDHPVAMIFLALLLLIDLVGFWVMRLADFPLSL